MSTIPNTLLVAMIIAQIEILFKGFLNCLTYLIFIQLTSYFFMYDFYKLIERNGLITTMCGFYASSSAWVTILTALINALFAGLSLNSALFVALNRVKRLLFSSVNEVRK